MELLESVANARRIYGLLEDYMHTHLSETSGSAPYKCPSIHYVELHLGLNCGFNSHSWFLRHAIARRLGLLELELFTPGSIFSPVPIALSIYVTHNEQSGICQVAMLKRLSMILQKHL